jgi:hypothetical protein
LPIHSAKTSGFRVITLSVMSAAMSATILRGTARCAALAKLDVNSRAMGVVVGQKTASGMTKTVRRAPDACKAQQGQDEVGPRKRHREPESRNDTISEVSISGQGVIDVFVLVLPFHLINCTLSFE